MPRVEFEPTTSLFKWSKPVRAVDSATTLIGRYGPWTLEEKPKKNVLMNRNKSLFCDDSTAMTQVLAWKRQNKQVDNRSNSNLSLQTDISTLFVEWEDCSYSTSVSCTSIPYSNTILGEGSINFTRINVMRTWCSVAASNNMTAAFLFLFFFYLELLHANTEKLHSNEVYSSILSLPNHHPSTFVMRHGITLLGTHSAVNRRKENAKLQFAVLLLSTSYCEGDELKVKR